MQPLPLTITKDGYSFTIITGEQYKKPFGQLLIDFLDTDIEALFDEIDRLQDKLSFVARDNDNDLNTHYDTLSYLLITRGYNPVICQFVINSIDNNERPFMLSGQGYNNDDLISALHNLRQLTKQLQDSFSYVLNIPLSEWPSDVIRFYNALCAAQDIKTHFYIRDDNLLQLYAIADLVSMLSLDLYQSRLNKIIIAKCANCGRFFIPSVRSDEKYCDRIFKDGKKCKDVGYTLNADEFQKAYRTAYKTQKARVRYHLESNPNYEKQHFIPWNDAALSAKKRFQDKNDIDGFKKWLKDNRNSF